MTGSGLARWDHDESDSISDEMVAAFRANPKFSDTFRHIVREALSLSATDAIFHANFRDMGRMVLGSLALYLHATGGLTHRRICELSSGGGILSAGRASAILLRLRMIGYVEAQSLRSDGSARLYTPTPQMIAAFKKRMLIEIRGLALAEPELNAFAGLFAQDDNFLALYRILGSRLVSATQRQRTDLAELEALVARDAGMLIIYAVLNAADRGGSFPATGPADISLSGLARRFGVSRTHVLRLLRDAEKAGFIERDAVTNMLYVTAALCEKMSTYLAVIHIALIAMVYRTIPALATPEGVAAS